LAATDEARALGRGLIGTDTVRPPLSGLMADEHQALGTVLTDVLGAERTAVAPGE